MPVGPHVVRHDAPPPPAPPTDAQHTSPAPQLDALEHASAPPWHVAPFAMHVAPPCWMQQVCVAESHDDAPHAMGPGGVDASTGGGPASTGGGPASIGKGPPSGRPPSGRPPSGRPLSGRPASRGGGGEASGVGRLVPVDGGEAVGTSFAPPSPSGSGMSAREPPHATTAAETDKTTRPERIARTMRRRLKARPFVVKPKFRRISCVQRHERVHHRRPRCRTLSPFSRLASCLWPS